MHLLVILLLLPLVGESFQGGERSVGRPSRLLLIFVFRVFLENWAVVQAVITGVFVVVVVVQTVITGVFVVVVVVMAAFEDHVVLRSRVLT